MKSVGTHASAIVKLCHVFLFQIHFPSGDECLVSSEISDLWPLLYLHSLFYSFVLIFIEVSWGIALTACNGNHSQVSTTSRKAACLASIHVDRLVTHQTKEHVFEICRLILLLGLCMLKNVLRRATASEPLCAHVLSLWCIFDDRFVIPTYIYGSRYANDRASLLDWLLSLCAQDQLWRYNRTLPAYSASMTDRDHNAPKPHSLPCNTSQRMLTLCTSALYHRVAGLMQSTVYYPSNNSESFSNISISHEL